MGHWEISSCYLEWPAILNLWMFISGIFHLIFSDHADYEWLKLWKTKHQIRGITAFYFYRSRKYFTVSRKYSISFEILLTLILRFLFKHLDLLPLPTNVSWFHRFLASPSFDSKLFCMFIILSCVSYLSSVFN